MWRHSRSTSARVRTGWWRWCATAAPIRSRAPFVFCAKRADRVKIVWWDGSGLSLFAKRLDEYKFRWPRVANGVIRLATPQFGSLNFAIGAPIQTRILG